MFLQFSSVSSYSFSDDNFREIIASITASAKVNIAIAIAYPKIRISHALGIHILKRTLDAPFGPPPVITFDRVKLINRS